MVLAHDRLEGVRVDEVQEGVPLYAGPGLSFSKQGALQLQLHQEVPETPWILEQTLTLIRLQLLPLADELDDQTDLIRSIAVERLPGVDYAGHQAGG